MGSESLREWRGRTRSQPRGLRLAAVLFIAVAGLAALVPGSADAYVYWANSEGAETIGRANLDGSSANQGFIPGASGPCGVAVSGTQIFWANRYLLNTIGQANLDGSSPNQGFIPGDYEPCGVAVDGAHIYWANGTADAIGRANLDGSSAEQTFVNAKSPCGVAVDDSHIYWTTGNGDSIGRSNLNGSSPEEGFIEGANVPCGIAVDGSHVYWTNSHANSIGRANLDGGSVNQNFITGAAVPCGVAVDGSHVYWANLTGGSIGRANLDGSSADQNFISGATVPCGVAVDSYPHATRTSVSCGPGPLRLPRPFTCIATVTDPASPSAAPTGMVGFSSGTGAFSPSSSCVLSASGPDQASCQVTYTSAGAGTKTIRATYSGTNTDATSGVAISLISPSNGFRILAAKLRRGIGTAQLVLAVPGAGSLTLNGHGIQKIMRVFGEADNRIKLPVRPLGARARRLRKNGSVEVTARISFLPNGGEPRTILKRLTLKRQS